MTDEQEREESLQAAKEKFAMVQANDPFRQAARLKYPRPEPRQRSAISDIVQTVAVVAVAVMAVKVILGETKKLF